MKDIITYIPDLEAFRIEASNVATDEDHYCYPVFDIDEDNNLTYNAVKIPVHYNGNRSACLIRGDEEHLNHLDSISRLGECINGEYVFDNEESKTIYESVHDTTEKTFADEDGTEHTYNPPYKIGVFA